MVYVDCRCLCRNDRIVRGEEALARKDGYEGVPDLGHGGVKLLQWDSCPRPLAGAQPALEDRYNGVLLGFLQPKRLVHSIKRETQHVLPGGLKGSLLLQLVHCNGGNCMVSLAIYRVEVIFEQIFGP